MTTVATGHQAEQAAAAYLKRQGYKIMALNWRTKYCEIDIVAQQNHTVYFVEVKYRLQNNQGAGLDYITPNKLRQMAFAAELWVQANNWPGDYQLAVIELGGPSFTITAFVTDL